MKQKKTTWYMRVLFLCGVVFVVTNSASAATPTAPTAPKTNPATDVNLSASTQTPSTAVDTSQNQVQYTQLENIPGFEGKNKTFPEYVASVYKLALWIIGISAFFMLSVGGFMYITSAGNTSAAGNAKSTIKDALIGLVLGLFTWLLLNTINPDLTTINFSGLVSGTSSPVGDTTPTVPAAGQYSHDEAVVALSAAGISVHSSGNCSDQNNKNCTSLQGIPKDTITRLIALHKTCGSCFTAVSGGTEVGHTSHGAGKARVDVTPEDSLGTFLSSSKDKWGSYGITQICTTSSWQKISYNCGTYIEQKPHIHLGF